MHNHAITVSDKNSIVYVPGIDREIDYTEVINRDYFPPTVYILANTKGRPLGRDSPETPIVPVFSTEQGALRYRLHNEEYKHAAVVPTELEKIVTELLQEVLVLLDPNPHDLKAYDSCFIIPE